MLSLSQVLDSEHQAVSQGEVAACGADHHGDPAEPCMRVAGHEETGQANREAHARLVDQPAFPGEEPRYWVTWMNQTAQGRPTSQLTKPDAP